MDAKWVVLPISLSVTWKFLIRLCSFRNKPITMQSARDNRSHVSFQSLKLLPAVILHAVNANKHNQCMVKTFDTYILFHYYVD